MKTRFLYVTCLGYCLLSFVNLGSAVAAQPAELPESDFSTKFAYTEEGCVGTLEFSRSSGLGEVRIATQCGTSTCEAEYKIVKIHADGPRRIIDLMEEYGSTNRLISGDGYTLERNDGSFCGMGAMMQGRYAGSSSGASQAAQMASAPENSADKAALRERYFQEAKAKIQSVRGKPFPLDTDDAGLIAQLIRKQHESPLTPEEIQEGNDLHNTAVFIVHSAENVEDLGYSLEATVIYTLDNIEKYGYRYWATLQRLRRMELITPYFAILERPEFIKPFLEQGIMSKQVVRRILDFVPSFNSLYGTNF